MTQTAENVEHQSNIGGYGVWKALLAEPKHLVLWGTLVVVWGLLALQLGDHWGSESYYNYGGAIPFFSLFLFYRRMQDSPFPSSEPRVSIAGFVVLVVCLLAIIPFRMLNEVNPFWRVPLMIEGLLAFAATLGVLGMVGGRAFLRHFGFVVFFMMTMVPWPYQIEIKIIQTFTQITAEATVVVIQLLGYPGTLTGSIINVGMAQVGVDDACSGIRSLQTLGMVALFLGEFFRFSAIKRVVIIVLMIGLVIVFNLMRSVGLTLIVLNGGDELYNEWHDPLGMITFIGSILVLYGLCELLNIGGQEPAEAKGPLPAFTWPKISTPLLGVGIFLAALPETSVWAWFNYKESQAGVAPDWDVKWPDADSEMKPEFLEIPERVSTLLSYDYAERVRFHLSDRVVGEMYYYGYDGDSHRSSVSSYGHSPTICMKASGATLERELDPLNIEFEGFNIPFNHYLFTTSKRSGERPVQVFWCLWEKRNMGVQSHDLESLSRSKQFELLLKGRRDYARKVILVQVPGELDFGTSRVLVAKTIRELVVEQ